MTIAITDCAVSVSGGAHVDQGEGGIAYKDFGDNQLARWTEAIVIELADHVGDYPNENYGEP